jgi:hypothetical protein
VTHAYERRKLRVVIRWEQPVPESGGRDSARPTAHERPSNSLRAVSPDSVTPNQRRGNAGQDGQRIAQRGVVLESASRSTPGRGTLSNSPDNRPWQPPQSMTNSTIKQRTSVGAITHANPTLRSGNTGALRIASVRRLPRSNTRACGARAVPAFSRTSVFNALLRRFHGVRTSARTRARPRRPERGPRALVLPCSRARVAG